MELKKNPKFDTHKKIGTFRNLGLTISLLAVLAVFEFPPPSEPTILDLGEMHAEFEDILDIPPTTQPPPPPPKVQIPEIIEVPDEEEIEEEIEVELDVEVTEELVIEDIVFAEEPEEEETDEILTIVEQKPEFPGGMTAFREFLAKNIKYPGLARRMGVEGRVYVQFVVERDGSLTDIQVVKGLGAGCDEESVRVMKLVPKFAPGKQRGNPVRVKMVMPIFYKLG